MRKVNQITHILIKLSRLTAIVLAAFFITAGIIFAQSANWSGPIADPPVNNRPGYIWNSASTQPDADITIDGKTTTGSLTVTSNDATIQGSEICVASDFSSGECGGGAGDSYWDLTGKDIENINIDGGGVQVNNSLRINSGDFYQNSAVRWITPTTRYLEAVIGFPLAGTKIYANPQYGSFTFNDINGETILYLGYGQDVSGNVGVGDFSAANTPNRNAKLHIKTGPTSYSTNAEIDLQTQNLNLWAIYQAYPSGSTNPVADGGDLRFWNTDAPGDKNVLVLENKTGNVGIGVTVPSQKLQVNGNVRVDGRHIYLGAGQDIYGDNSSAIYYDSNHASVTQLIMSDSANRIYGRLYGSGSGQYFGLLDGDGQWSYLASKDAYTQFRINNVAIMTMRSNGNVGIGGEPAGDAKLWTRGPIFAENEFRIYSSPSWHSGFRMLADAYGTTEYLQVGDMGGSSVNDQNAILCIDKWGYVCDHPDANLALLQVDANNSYFRGKIGIGVNSPERQLHIRETSSQGYDAEIDIQSLSNLTSGSGITDPYPVGALLPKWSIYHEGNDWIYNDTAGGRVLAETGVLRFTNNGRVVFGMSAQSETMNTGSKRIYGIVGVDAGLAIGGWTALWTTPKDYDPSDKTLHIAPWAGQFTQVMVGPNSPVDLTLNQGNLNLNWGNLTIMGGGNGNAVHRRGKIRLWAESNPADAYVSHAIGTESFNNTYGPGISYASSIGHKFYVHGNELAAQIGMGGPGTPANRQDSRFYGNIGAVKYCDQNLANCKSITELGVGGSGGPWTVSGTNIYNSNTGNVGIGTPIPASKLTVAGAAVAGVNPLAKFIDTTYGNYASLVQNGNGAEFVGNQGVYAVSPTAAEGIGISAMALGSGETYGGRMIAPKTGLYAKGSIGLYATDLNHTNPALYPGARDNKIPQSLLGSSTQYAGYFDGNLRVNGSIYINSSNYAVYGYNTGYSTYGLLGYYSYGVYGSSPSGIGVYGSSSSGTGVYGYSYNGWSGYFSGSKGAYAEKLFVGTTDTSQSNYIKATINNNNPTQGQDNAGLVSTIKWYGGALNSSGISQFTGLNGYSELGATSISSNSGVVSIGISAAAVTGMNSNNIANGAYVSLRGANIGTWNSLGKSSTAFYREIGMRQHIGSVSFAGGDADLNIGVQAASGRLWWDDYSGCNLTTGVGCDDNPIWAASSIGIYARGNDDSCWANPQFNGSLKPGDPGYAGSFTEQCRNKSHLPKQSQWPNISEAQNQWAAVLDGKVLVWDNLYVNSHTYLHGNVYYSGGFYYNSDQRLKKSIQPINGALDRLLQLKGVNFEWKDSERGQGVQTGFVAQDVQKVFPSWVSTDSSGYLSVGPKGFDALTVEAFRELQRQNDELSQRVEKLENIIESFNK